MKLAFGVLMASLTLSVAPGTQPEVYSPGNGVTLPVVVRDVKPQYTDGAMKARIEGTVVLESVVLADGTVGEVRVVQSLDSVYGLDEQAMKAMKQWRFKPGTKEGKPVAVRISCEMSFRLK